MLRALIAVAVLVGLGGSASAQRGGPQIPHGYEELYKESPTIELVTMGIGSLIWERHGHIALCVVYLDREDCYNYGVGDFHDPVAMGLGFLRGKHSFWVAKQSFDEMMWIYHYTDRTIWRQPLPLTSEQKQKVIDKLESDILEENKYYAYDHFEDNCTTRVRNILDDATGGAFKSIANEPTDGKTFRDLARDGFFGMRIPLLITDLAMGRSTDRVPTYWERMFLPQYLREAVVKKWGVKPIVWYQRKGDRTITDKKLCNDGSIVHEPDDCEPHGPSGRILFVLAILGLTAPAWATRLWGRFQRVGMAFTVVPMSLIALVFWFIAIITPLPYLHLNETCLILMPFDLALLMLPARIRVRYAQGRVGMLAIVALLMLIGVLAQPIWWLALWPAIPAAIVGFFPKR
jgi:hypothetical protein